MTQNMDEMLNYEREHLEELRPFLPECAVLLKKDGHFPLDAPGDIALYGSGARHTVKGGTGSGEVNSRFFVTVEDGLRKAGFQITTASWLDAYDRELVSARERFIREIKGRARRHHTLAIYEGMGAVMPEPEYRIPLDGAGDTAVYVLSRVSGEGNDRQAIQGDILLTDTEVRDILQLQRQYARFMLVLNVGGPVDLSPVSAEVGNILLLSQLGVETGSALADILLGASPSGKLATTWAAWKDCPQIGDFGCFNDTRYREGIYVGYRYYESEGVTPLFPFGYGLSWTDFVWSDEGTVLDGDLVTVSALVRNTGTRSGKETLQLYVSKPEVRLDQPFQDLASFVKTSLLPPGGEERVSLSFRFPDLASWDSAGEGWVLEKGDYFLRLGSSSDSTRPVARLRLEQDTVTRRAKCVCGPTDFADWQPTLQRIDMFPPEVPILTVQPESLVCCSTDYALPEPVEPEAAAMNTEELIRFSIGAFDSDAGILSVIGDASRSVAGAAGETVSAAGIPSVVMADGPAGLRLSRDYVMGEKGPVSVGQSLPETMTAFLPGSILWVANALSRKPKGEHLHQYATAIPIGTAIAQSWNTDFARLCGDLVGDEMERLGVDLWLAPAMNIHRDIRCGRNFEYFSEDPLLSGLFAAALTEGVQCHPGRGVTVKHYAANNQEYNRYQNNSVVSERAMREIYLRGFGICVRKAQPRALMTSYNLLNGKHTSEHSGLIRDILRCEFGFEGLVMTDWVIAAMKNRGAVHAFAAAERVADAGGDLFMPGCRKDAEGMRRAVRNGTLSQDRLRKNVSRLIRLTKQLHRL